MLDPNAFKANDWMNWFCCFHFSDLMDQGPSVLQGITLGPNYIFNIVIVIVNSKLLKRHSKAKRRAPAYSRALRQIRGVFQRIVRGRQTNAKTLQYCQNAVSFADSSQTAVLVLYLTIDLTLITK